MSNWLLVHSARVMKMMMFPWTLGRPNQARAGLDTRGEKGQLAGGEGERILGGGDVGGERRHGALENE